jgi:flagellar motor switch protein FliN
MLHALEQAWQMRIPELKCSASEIKLDPGSCSALPDNTYGVLATIETSIGGTEGMMNLFMPDFTIDKICDRLTQLPEQPKPLPAEVQFLKEAKVTLSAVLGKTEATIEDVFNLKEDAILKLDRFAGKPVDVYASNVKVAEAEVVVVGEHFALRLTDIVANHGSPPIDAPKP